MKQESKNGGKPSYNPNIEKITQRLNDLGNSLPGTALNLQEKSLFYKNDRIPISPTKLSPTSTSKMGERNGSLNELQTKIYNISEEKKKNDNQKVELLRQKYYNDEQSNLLANKVGQVNQLFEEQKTLNNVLINKISSLECEIKEASSIKTDFIVLKARFEKTMKEKGDMIDYHTSLEEQVSERERKYQSIQNELQIANKKVDEVSANYEILQDIIRKLKQRLRSTKNQNMELKQMIEKGETPEASVSQLEYSKLQEENANLNQTIEEMKEYQEILINENSELQAHLTKVMREHIKTTIEDLEEVEQSNNDLRTQFFQFESLTQENQLLKHRIFSMEMEKLHPESLTNMMQELEQIRGLAKSLQKKVDDMDELDEELCYSRTRIDDLVKENTDLKEKYENQTTPLKMEKSIKELTDSKELYKKIEDLQIENNKLRHGSIEDPLLSILDQECKNIGKVSSNDQDLEIMKTYISNLENEMKKLKEENSELRIRNIALSDKTPFSDDQIDIFEEKDIEIQEIPDDSQYWKNKCESMNARIKYLEEKLELSFMPEKDETPLISKTEEVYDALDSSCENFTDDQLLMDFEEDFEDEGLFPNDDFHDGTHFEEAQSN